MSPANALGAMKVIRLAAKSLVSGSRKWNHSVSSAENTIQVIKCSERDKCIRRHHGDRVQFQVPEVHNKAELSNVIISRLSADQAYNTVVVMGILTQLIAVRLSEFHSIVAPAELDGPLPLHAIS